MSGERNTEGASELEQAVAELAGTRQNLAQSMSALQHEFKNTFDWRQWVRRKPAMTLALAFALGFLLGRKI